MLLKTHKMVLALAILSGASAAQADILPGLDLPIVNLPDLEFGVLIKESNPGTPILTPGNLAYGFTPSIILSTGGKMRLDRAAVGYRVENSDSVNIAHFSGRQRNNGINGVWTFAQIDNSNVFFGEWNAEAATGPVGTKVAGTHNVFYAGLFPTGGVLNTDATYKIKSINNYSNNGTNVPTSDLTVNFAQQTARSTGDISFTNGNVRLVANGQNRAGELTAANVSVASAGGTGGALKGQFFTKDLTNVLNLYPEPDYVAGYVTFQDRDKNTAFGGVKKN